MMTNHNPARPAAKAVKRATQRSADKVEVVTARARLGPEVLRRMSLELPENLTYEDWVSCGAVLFRLGDTVLWWLGDWWRYGERRSYGDAAMQAAATGFALQSVKAAAWVATKFSEPSRRRDDVSFSHHREVSGLPRAEADELLAKAAAEKWHSRDLRREVQRRRHAERLGVATMKAAQDLAQLGKFAVLLADPPWRFDDAEPTRSVENHYQTLPLADICAWEVPAADDAALFLWVPASLLPTGLAVTKAWGFQYKTHFVWVKDTKGMGNYSRLQHELLFVATRGGLPPPLPANRSGSVFQAPRGAHSVKPTVAYEVIERAYATLPKVELFARSRRPGWTPLGDQVPDPTA